MDNTGGRLPFHPMTPRRTIRPTRRVVVLADAHDVPQVVADGPSPHVHTLPGMPDDLGLTDLWYTDPDAARPAAGAWDTAARDLAVAPDAGGTLFRVVQLPPDAGTEPFWHETATCDYNVLLAGELVLLLGESSENEVTLFEHDAVIVRGGKHAWSNCTDELAILATVAVATGSGAPGA
jgi:hypothetical protein